VLLPKAPSSVLGVADYRGEVIPVVDLRVRFGLPPSSPTRREKWIVIDVAHGAFDVRGPGRMPPPIRGPAIALTVDRVTEVFGTQGVELRAAPDLGGGEADRAIAGVTQKGAQLVFVLDPRSFRAISDSLAPPPMFASRGDGT
jgi:purine-binding chemotaxis protein CheW